MFPQISRAITGIKTCLRLRPFDVSTPDGREKERHRRILLSYIASFSAKIIGIAALIISTPLTLDYLGTERFGIWMTLSSLIVVLGFADLGIGNGLLNIIAEAHGRDDKKMAKRAVASSIVFLTTIGLILSLVFAMIYPMLDWGHLLGISAQESASEAGEAVAVLVGCVAINLPLLTAQRVQAGFQEGFQASLWQAVGSVFMLVGILLVIYIQAGLPWLVLAAVGGPTVAMGLNWTHQFFFVRRWLLPSLDSIEWKMAQRVVTLGAVWAWFQLMSFVGTAADNLIISHLFGAEAVGGYAVMARLLSGLLIAQVLSASLWPAFAEAFERGDLDWVRKTFRRTLILFSTYGLISALVMGFGSFWIIRIWVGPEMEPSPLMALGFALWSFITNFFAAIAALMANNRLIKQLTWLTTVGALCSLFLKLLFAPLLGITWVIWATVVGYGLVCIPGIIIAHRALNKQDANRDAGMSGRGAVAASERILEADNKA
ncbi:lipopolysaccharide biosynthesis protein [Pseudomonadota bacterium]